MEAIPSRPWENKKGAFPFEMDRFPFFFFFHEIFFIPEDLSLPGKGGHQVRIEGKQPGHELQPDFISGGIGNIIGLIMTGRHMERRKEIGDFLSCDSKKRPDENVPPGLYAGHAFGAASAKQMEENSFRLVIFMMGQSDLSALSFFRRFFKCREPKNAGHRFHRAPIFPSCRRNIHVLPDKGDMKKAAYFPYVFRFPFRRFPEMMVHAAAYHMDAFRPLYFL